MDGEIDLELYTLAIIRLNNALEKLDISNISEIKNMFEESSKDLQQLYEDTVGDLNQNEINLNEYYLFFENGKQTFPQYINILKDIKQPELEDSVNSLINVFTNFNKISEAFPKNEMIK